MQKKIFFILFLFFLVLGNAQEAKDLLGFPQKLDFNGTEYFISWSKEKSPTLTMQEYMPSDEDIKEFTQLINFSYFKKDLDIEMAIREKIERIQAMKDADKFAKVYDVTESPDGSEYIVDYTVSGVSPDEQPYLEYNIQRFKKYEGGNKSLLILGYIKRIYGADLKYASKSINKQRNQLIAAAIEFKIPAFGGNNPAPASTTEEVPAK